jgi:DNA-binding CsgD family transcriptional regulator
MVMIEWEKKMDAALERDEQRVRDTADVDLADLKSRLAGGAASRETLAGATLYEQVLDAAAKRRGVLPEIIMEEDYQELSYAEYPTPECLTPDELETIYLAAEDLPGWAKDRLRHMDNCRPCRNLFTTMRPDAKSLAIFDQAMDRALEESALSASRTKLRTKLRKKSQEPTDEFRKPRAATPDREVAIRRLTSREREIVQLLVAGNSTKEVAASLRISLKTAETHRSNIMRKLGLDSFGELVRTYSRNAEQQDRKVPGHC